MIASAQPVWREYAAPTERTALPTKPPSETRLILQPANRRPASRGGSIALQRFFAITDAWELSPLQQCRLLKIPSPQVLARYRLGQAPRLSATQQERAALVAHMHFSLSNEPSRADREARLKDRAWAWIHAPRQEPPFKGDSPLYFMLENGLPALREVARLLVRQSERRRS